MTLFSFTRFCLRVLAGLNEIIRRLKRNVILTIAIDKMFYVFNLFDTSGGSACSMKLFICFIGGQTQQTLNLGKYISVLK
jgi:hypothetical protein